MNIKTCEISELITIFSLNIEASRHAWVGTTPIKLIKWWKINKVKPGEGYYYPRQAEMPYWRTRHSRFMTEYFFTVIKRMEIPVLECPASSYKDYCKEVEVPKRRWRRQSLRPCWHTCGHKREVTLHTYIHIKLVWQSNVIHQIFVCVEVLRLSQPYGVCRARSVYLTTLLLGRLSPVSGQPVVCTFFHQKLSGRERKTVKSISWSISTKECCWPGGSRARNLLIFSRTHIQLSHRGWQWLLSLTYLLI